MVMECQGLNMFRPSECEALGDTRHRKIKKHWRKQQAKKHQTKGKAPNHRGPNPDKAPSQAKPSITQPSGVLKRTKTRQTGNWVSYKGLLHPGVKVAQLSSSKMWKESGSASDTLWNRLA